MNFIDIMNNIKSHLKGLTSRGLVKIRDLRIWKLVVIFSAMLLIINTLNLSFLKVDVI